MSFFDYLNDQKPALLFSAACALFFSALLWLFGIGMGELLLLLICFICIAGSFMLHRFFRQRKRLQYLQSVQASLDQKYLIAEIADKPESSLESVYFQLMKTALKSMTDETAGVKRLNEEYRDFIEQWVHEIKVPITGIQLLCENNKSDMTRKVKIQTEFISKSVERVLFYARLGSVEKDYLITEISLKDCVLEVLAENKQFLIQSHVCVHTDNLFHTVYSDKKWLQFILGQIIMNSVKYQGSRSPVIDISSQDKETYVSLSLTDNGVGIRPSEISRVFDKGFVGSNGRTGKNATGMGLYLCRQLCMKLGIEIEIESEWQKSATLRLHFPKSSFLRV